MQEIFDLFEGRADLSGEVWTEKFKVLKGFVKVDINNNKDLLPNLLGVLKNTNSHQNRGLVAYLLVDFKNEWHLQNDLIVDALVATINKPETVGYRGHLTYACSEFDCSKHFFFFVELVINDTYHSAWNAVETIINMNEISYTDIDIALKKINEAKLMGQITEDKSGLIREIEEYFSEPVEDDI